MHEHDRLALAFVEKGYFDPVMREPRHGATIRSGWSNGKRKGESQLERLVMSAAAGVRLAPNSQNERIVMHRVRLACLAALFVLSGGAAHAQISDDVVKIGVLTDLSGPAATATGPGSVTAAQMAVEDFGGKVLGEPIDSE